MPEGLINNGFYFMLGWLFGWGLVPIVLKVLAWVGRTIDGKAP